MGDYLKRKQREAIKEIYRTLYNKAKPGLDLETIEDYEDLEPKEEGHPRYALHYLPKDEIKDVIEIVCEDKGLKEDWMRKPIRTTVMLGSAPTSIEKVVVENRKEEGLSVEMFE